jgi:TolA-binding protein
MKTTIHFVLTFFLVACGSDRQPTPEKEITLMTEARTQVAELENKAFSQDHIDQRAAQALLDGYKAYAAKFPKDSVAPEYLFRAAGICRSLGRPSDAIQLFDRVIASYSRYPKVVDSYFLKAITLDDDLAQLGRAKEAYELVISKFPDHPYASDAARMIEYLGLSDEELIQRFERMNADSSTAGTPQ